MSTQAGHRRTNRHGMRARLGALNPLRLLPEETTAHLRNAAREQLLAVRSLLDAAIARLEQPKERHENA